MARTFSYSLSVSGHRIQDISVTWGLRPISEVRSGAPTYGVDIEVPAVIELLDLIASGAVTAEQVRDTLSHLATEINEEQDREHAAMLERMERVRFNGPEVKQALTRADDRWVYAVSAEDNPGVVKIGVATNIRSRIKGLQTGAASRIVLRWSARGGLPLESHLHEKFHRRRMSGEWFDFRRVADPVKVISEAADLFLSAGGSTE